jgi:hypothetical protein
LESLLQRGGRRKLTGEEMHLAAVTERIRELPDRSGLADQLKVSFG